MENFDFDAADCMRAWYEDKAFGTSRKQLPLQSTIYAAAAYPSMSNHAALEKELANFFNSLKAIDCADIVLPHDHANEDALQDDEDDDDFDITQLLPALSKSPRNAWESSQSHSLDQDIKYLADSIVSSKGVAAPPAPPPTATATARAIPTVLTSSSNIPRKRPACREAATQVDIPPPATAAAVVMNIDSNHIYDAPPRPTRREHSSTTTRATFNNSNNNNHNQINSVNNRTTTEGAKSSRDHERGDNNDENIGNAQTAEEARRSLLFRTAMDQFRSEGGALKSTHTRRSTGHPTSSRKFSVPNSSNAEDEAPLPAELEGHDRALVEKIELEIVSNGDAISFEDIAGLRQAKQCVIELICWPMSRPDLFTGLRSLPRGVLLFGPPGTGKTLIGKAVAHQAGATFFSISASSLTSKWIGEGEKTVRTLFAVAAYRQPSVVFIDEVDSLLCQRSSDENEASRRMKTEFLVQLDGAGNKVQSGSRVVVVGATNRPEELDEAARRRFVKRIYIPLPDAESREQLFGKLLADSTGGSTHSLTQSDVAALVAETDGYSGADIRSLCTEAAMGPLRELAAQNRHMLGDISASDVPSISVRHFQEARACVQPSVSPSDLRRYIEWNRIYGSFRVLV